MATAIRFHAYHALLTILCCTCKLSQQQTPTSTSMPTLSRGNLPTVTIATPSAWVDIRASIPSNLGTDQVVVTSASVGGLPQIYLGASIAASAHAAVQSNCSQANSPDCQSSVGNAVKADNALEKRIAPIALLLAAVVALIAVVVSYDKAEDVNAQPQLVNFQSEGYTQMIAAQHSSSVVIVTASDDPNPVTVPLITTTPLSTTSSWITSATATDSVVISTATKDGPGYFSGDSFLRIPTVDVVPLTSILAATQSGVACISPSVRIPNPLGVKLGVLSSSVNTTSSLRVRADSLLDWGSAVGDVVKIWPDAAVGGELQLLRTAQNLQLGALNPALLQAAQNVVTLGEQITHLILDNTGLIAVAAVLIIIATVIQNCLVAEDNAFLIPKEAFSDTTTSTQSSSCPPKTLQPHCINCGGMAGTSSCSGIKTKSNLWKDCPCYSVAVYKCPPGNQQIIAAPTSTSPKAQATSGQLAVGTIKCETSNASPKTEDVTAAINRLKALGSTKTCVQKNPFGSKCTTMTFYGSAAISVCGPEGITTFCYLAAQWAQDIQNACSNGGRVGGQDNFLGKQGTYTIEVINFAST